MKENKVEVNEDNRKYHYLVGVGVKSIQSESPGKLYRDLLLEWNDENFRKFSKALEASKNPLWKQSLGNACNIFEVQDFPSIIKMIQLRAKVQPLMLIHFINDYKLDEETITTFVEHSDLKTLKKYELKI